MDCLKIVHCKNYFSPSKIFVLQLLKMVVNQKEHFRHELRFVVKNLVDTKCDKCGIYRKMSDVYGEAGLVKPKDAYKWLNMDLPLRWAKVKMIEYILEMNIEEKIEWSVKKLILTVFSDMKDPVIISFL